VTILLVFGGEGSEHDVSVMGAKNVLAAIEPKKFTVQLMYIDRQGRFWRVGNLDVEQPELAEELLPLAGTGSLQGRKSGQQIKPQVILPLIHGRGGEDGGLPALAKLLHLPIVGCDSLTSAICLDKDVSRRLLHGVGIDSLPYQVVYASDKRPSFDELANQLGPILFVKPAREGSSIGVSRVASETELSIALDQAFNWDNKVLIEQAVNGRELECAVLGNTPDVKASGVGEIIVSNQAAFYDYDTKYVSQTAARLDIPAKLSDGLSQKISSIAWQAFIAVGGQGLARVDFFLTNDRKIYLNEINTLPGFTNISMYPKLWQQAGLGYSELIERLIDLAFKAYRAA
jgi:D-alanine-D-alanine ligase